jgi:hypothetical protein
VSLKINNQHTHDGTKSASAEEVFLVCPVTQVVWRIGFDQVCEVLPGNALTHWHTIRACRVVERFRVQYMTSKKIKHRITDFVYTDGVAQVSPHGCAGCQRERAHCALGVVACILTVVHESRTNALGGITFARG